MKMNNVTVDKKSFDPDKVKPGQFYQYPTTNEVFMIGVLSTRMALVSLNSGSILELSEHQNYMPLIKIDSRIVINR